MYKRDEHIKRQYVLENLGSLLDNWIVIFFSRSKFLRALGEETSTFGLSC